MTLPNERLKSISYTRDFLHALLDPKATPKVPKAVRRWAGTCLRHFPFEHDLKDPKSASESLFGIYGKKRS